jgi:hypothetical protein
MLKRFEIGLVVIYTQNMVPRNILGFFMIECIVVVFVLHETKYGELHVENTGIVQQTPQIFVFR